MKCSLCGGRVEWQGPLTNLTHTKCLSCGAINSQEVDPPPDDEADDSDTENAAADLRRMDAKKSAGEPSSPVACSAFEQWWDTLGKSLYSEAGIDPTDALKRVCWFAWYDGYTITKPNARPHAEAVADSVQADVGKGET